MNTVEIQSVADQNGKVLFRAIAGDKSSTGVTMGQALDALTQELGEITFPAFLVSLNVNPDPFFSATQQQRLAELMDLWRSHRDLEQEFPTDLQTELDALVETELQASIARTQILLSQSSS